MSNAIFKPCSPKQAMMLENKATLTVVGGAAGCVPGNTEFLTPKGWKRIDEYEPHDQVGFFDPTTNEVVFDFPLKYIVKPVDTFYRIYTEDFSITACEEHGLVFSSFDSLIDLPVSFLLSQSDLHGISDFGNILTLQDIDGGEYTPVEKRFEDFKVEEVYPEDGLRYCFAVETGLFVIRQGGEPFVTGNSGKSYTLLLDPLQYVDDPDFDAIVFRRNTKQLRGQGGLWQTARKIYGQVPKPLTPKFNKTELIVYWPSGASIQFSHLQYESTVEEHQGLQYSAIYFDEGTHFSWMMVEYLMSRLRSEAKNDAFVKVSCNPDPQSWLREFIEPYFLDEAGYPIKERDGHVRYWATIEGERVWSGSYEWLAEEYPEYEDGITSFSFISATIRDNPVLMEKEPKYYARLKALNDVDRARLLDGNWFIMPRSVSYVHRDFFNKAEQIPVKAVWCRAWDKASREYDPNATGSNKWPDYTASVKLGKDSNGDLYIVGDYHNKNRDRITGIQGRFRERAGSRDNIITYQSQYDGRDCTVILPKDPGAAGIVEFQESQKKLTREGFAVKADPSVSTASKLNRFIPFCSEAENGTVYIVESSFEPKTLEAFYKELETFDGERSSASQGKHDDWCDSLSAAYAFLAKARYVRIVPRNQISSKAVAADRLARINPLQT